jgi:ribose transport system substrate-binding protein
MKKLLVLLLVGVLALGSVGCSGQETAADSASAPAEKETFLIGMSQCNLGEPWRVAMNNQIKAAADKYEEFEVVFSDAAQDNSKQIADVENFIVQQVDLIIISPNEAKPLTAVVKKAYDANIPVIVLDRSVEGEDFTQFIGGDNKIIGEQAGKYVAEMLKETGGKIVEIKGLEGSTPQKDRHDGFMSVIEQHDNIEVVVSQSCDWLRDKAITVMEAALQSQDQIDVVYGHNDPAAVGAFIAAKNANREKEIAFIGIDALPTPDGGIQSVINGELTATYVYPTGGAEAIESAYKLLVKGETLEKKITLGTIEITKDNAEEMLAQFK